MCRSLQLTCIAVAALIAVDARAANVFWQGGADILTASNYSDGVSTNLAPQTLDLLFLGNSGTVTHSVSGITEFQKIRIGQDLASSGGVGPATLTVNNGAQLLLSSPGGTLNASVIIGNGSGVAGSGVDGTLIIDGAGSKVTSAQLVQIGFGDKSTASATVKITNGGSLVTTTGNINLGERNAVGSGVPGHLEISDAASSITITAASASLNVGVRATSTYLQSDGTVSVGGITIGQNSANNSSMTINGGTLSTKTNGVILVGTNSNQNSSLSVGGTAVLNLGSNITVGDTTAKNPSLTVSGNADINIPGT